MAMSAVLVAARRLTGQQPQAILRSAVANGKGLLLNRGANAPRRYASSEANGLGTEHPSFSGDSRLMAADRNKEELVDLLHEIQMNKDIPHNRRMRDRWLLQRLTSHVHPRPSNPEWKNYLRENAANRWLGATAILFSFLYITEKQVEKWVEAESNKASTVSSAEPSKE